VLFEALHVYLSWLLKSTLHPLTLVPHINIALSLELNVPQANTRLFPISKIREAVSVVCHVFCVCLMQYASIEVFVNPPSQTVLSVVVGARNGFQTEKNDCGRTLSASLILKGMSRMN
jgi:hypothetical protein